MNKKLYLAVEQEILKELKKNQTDIAQIQRFSIPPDSQWERGTAPDGSMGFVLGPVWSLDDLNFRDCFIPVQAALHAWFVARFIEDEISHKD